MQQAAAMRRARSSRHQPLPAGTGREAEPPPHTAPPRHTPCSVICGTRYYHLIDYQSPKELGVEETSTVHNRSYVIKVVTDLKGLFDEALQNMFVVYNVR